MTSPGSWRGVIQQYRKYPLGLQGYFCHVPKLAEDFPWDVCLAYQFARVELAHNMSIYCGAVKLHRTDPGLTWKAVQGQHMTREGFRQLYGTIFGKALPREVLSPIEAAEKVRDGIMHGKVQSEKAKRGAVCDVLSYAHAMNEFTGKTGGLRPFGDLRGFKGRAKSLDREASRWILKGIGLQVS